ncbi:MAG: 4'-phosphopantetheinyl transferase superfamily protein [Pseudomonadales bacterium]|nr:4'-phosphopantetheinyl transferase superfamily protein [Pseudomonadales bacterium]
MPHSLTLADNQIDLWLCNPQDPCFASSALQTQYQHCLSDDEISKVARLRFAKHRHDALITRALVRDTLSHYLPDEPHQLAFVSEAKGKPKLSQPKHSGLWFNLSHTEGLIVCAVSKLPQLGVDCEQLTRDNEILAIAQRYFSTSETAELFSLAPEHQRSRFFDYWTLKESYIKACGQGLAIPLDHFSFSIDDEGGSYHLGQCKQAISIAFDAARQDQPAAWQSQLLYPSHQLRIALSVKQASQQPFDTRFFYNQPLISYQQILLEDMGKFV